ncbi:MAG: putative damage-inducible protein DinB [Enterobacterales bacterium]|jgi:uncharacterized damage-inducible protein DinB
MSLKSNFELLADYNQYMNKGIYKAASQLSSLELAENRGAFFGSIIATLNHILVADTIWLKRFSEHSSKFKSLSYVRSLGAPKSLDMILYNDINELLISRGRMDDTIQAFSLELTDKVLASPLSYSNIKGEPFTKNLGYLTQHFFNHQTHHRGQVSTLLNQAGLSIGTTDLLLSIKEV